MKISEIFHSIEGEGIAIGRPEVFIRFSGCNLRCRWCDTRYALGRGTEMSVGEVTGEVSKHPCKSVSVTGGEPLLQREELFEIIQRLKKMGYWIQINTNGTILDEAIFKLTDLISMDCKCPSSGMKSDLEVVRRTKELFDSKTQFKFVVSNKKDYEYAKETHFSLNAANVVFQPEWNNREFTKRLVNLVKKDNAKVRVILQQQKIIWGTRRGV